MIDYTGGFTKLDMPPPGGGRGTAAGTEAGTA